MSKTVPCNFYHAGQQEKCLKDYKHFRLYSHVIDQYDFKINNKLMAQKIINPRRDKIIMDSLLHASPKYILKKKKILPPNEKQPINGRKAFEQKGLKRPILSNHLWAQVQQESKQAQRSNNVPQKSTGSTLESNVEYIRMRQAKNIINSENLEAADEILRNNYVGRIKKNTRQLQWQEKEVLANKINSDLSRPMKNLVLGQLVDEKGKSGLIISNSGRNKQNYRKKSYKSGLMYRQRHQQMEESERSLQTVKGHEKSHAY